MAADNKLGYAGPDIQGIKADSASLRLTRVEFAPGFVIDEVQLDASDLSVLFGTPPPGDLPFRCGEVRLRAVISEINLNLLLEKHTPPDVPVKNLKAALLSGRILLRGQFLKAVMALPFAMEATPVIVDGKRIKLTCAGSQVGGMSLPQAAVQVIEMAINEKITIDLTQSPIPISLQELRVEPGRITATGTARLEWKTLNALMSGTNPQLKGRA